MVDLPLFDTVEKIVIVVFLSGLIGLEREVKFKDAGLRTHILLGMSTTLLVLTSFYLSDIYSGTTKGDPARIITGIITGIGFLCGGAIFRGDSHVMGLTTAASMWIVAGIGITVGCGMYQTAALITIAACVVLIFVKPIEQKVKEKFINKKI
ncbi:MAG: MgtC/SapB family protein [Candidatus Omnitrophica bacterium]|nr:MgtC/SapB family protein [Candidatus Omnitrophota bacterium]